MKKYFLLMILFLSCSPNNNSIEKIAEANSLIAKENYEEGIKILTDLKSSDKDVAKALANAHLQYGNFLMYNEEMDRKVKYQLALKEFRTALSIDNNLAEARSNADLIESIYSSMGKEIPQ